MKYRNDGLWLELRKCVDNQTTTIFYTIIKIPTQTVYEDYRIGFAIINDMLCLYYNDSVIYSYKLDAAELENCKCGIHISNPSNINKSGYIKKLIISENVFIFKNNYNRDLYNTPINATPYITGFFNSTYRATNQVLKVVKDPIGNNKVIQCTCYKDYVVDSETFSKRSEIIENNENAFKIGERRRYSYYLYLDDNYEVDTQEEIIGQFHDLGLGIMPNIAIYNCPDGKLKLAQRYLETVPKSADEVRSAFGNNPNAMLTLCNLSDIKGKWTKFEFDVTAGYLKEHNPHLCLKINDKIIIENYEPNCYNCGRSDNKVTYFQVGIYKWTFTDEFISNVNERTVYIKELTRESAINS